MKNIIYTAKIQEEYYEGDFIKLYKINRFFEDKKLLIQFTNHLLDNETSNEYIDKDFFAQLKNTESNYKKFLKDTWFDINFYSTIEHKEFISYKTFVDNNLDKIFWNLLFTKGTDRLRYSIQYCNHDNFNVKMVACDVLRHNDIIEFNNKKMIEYIIQGKIDLIEEITQ